MLASLVLNAVLAVASSAQRSNRASVPAVAGTATPPAATLPTPQFRRFGIADGLPGGPVYALAQDHNGLMWFGSAGGLLRYDGTSFKLFRHVEGDPDSLPANTTYTLLVDRQNRIWTGGIATGLTVYDQRSGHFRHWVHDDRQPASLADNEVWSIAQTADGALWVATDDGLDRMRADGRSFDHVALDLGDRHFESFGATRALLAEPDGRLWIGAESGLYVRERDGSVHRVAIDPSWKGDLSRIWSIEGGEGEVRVALEGGLLIIGKDRVARPLAARALAGLRIMSSARDLQGRLWIGKPDGLLLDAGNHQLQPVDGHPLLPGGLPGNKTWSTLIDREGGLWVTFDESSIAYLPPGWDGFSRFTHVPDDSDSLSEVAVSALRMSRDGKLWVGGENGWIDKLDVATGAVEHVLHGMQAQVVSLAEDLHGRLWIDVPGGLRVFDHGKLDSIDLRHTRLRRPVLLSASADGKVYVASWGQGVFVIDPDTRAITQVPSAADVGGNAPMPAQLSLSQGHVWFASDAGLMRLEDGKLEFVPGVSRSGVDMFDFDRSGFWLTRGLLLEHYLYADGRASIDQKLDLGRGGVSSDPMVIRVDQQGALWLFGNPGLWRMDPMTHRLTVFGPEQGLSNALFGAAVSAMAPDGTLVAPDSGGVVAFQPDQVMRAEKPASRAVPQPLTLTELRVSRRGHDVQLPLDAGTLRLGWRDRDLRASARLASYINPAADHYRFRLSGFDTAWVDTDARGEREFAGLAAGDYTLDVKASGPDGVWSRLDKPLRLTVEAPPWQRWWAWVIYALLLAGAAAWTLQTWRRRLAQRHRLQLVEQQRQLAEAASAAKTQFLATLSHEIRTPMTGVMGMAELLLGTPLTPLQQDYTQAMQRSGGMLLKLLNDALDLARIEAGRMALEPAPFDPAQLLRDVAQLEQGLAHAKGIRFVLELDDAFPERLIGDAVRIKQVLLNLANNALKFTEQGRVVLRGQRIEGGLMLSVSDTGPGIPEASQSRLFHRFEQEEGPQRAAGSGLGLAICRELVEMMGGGIELESRMGHGSTFRVRLPLAEPVAEPLPPRVATPHIGGRQLLLVEDDMIVAAVIRGLLENQGHAVSHVGNGLAALAELAHAHFDAVLLDLDLPGVDGFQIARLIRQSGQAVNIPIIAVTARSGGNDEVRARAAGMDGFLRKPLSGDELAGALARIMLSGPAAGSQPD